MIVLADTSVWIRSLRGQPSYRSEMDWLLSKGDIAGHALVYGELLIGDAGDRTVLLSSYQRIRHATMVPHEEVVAFVRDRRLNGRGIGWIDAHLLASATVNRFQLWTADRRLATTANELGVGYTTPVV